MTKDNNIQKGDYLDHGGLDNLLSQLKIPPSPNGKEEVWSRILDGVENEQKQASFNYNAFRWIAAIVVLLIVSSVGVNLQFAKKRYEAPYGEVAYLTLPDSSVVTLNAGTTIEHKEYGFNRRREVRIDGEALFEVNSSDRDFVVHAGNYSVRVLGTRFNVFYRDNILEVKCIEGLVGIEHKGIETKKISAGEGILLQPKSNELKRLSVDIKKSASWVHGEFYYTQTPLSTVFDEFERQFNVKVKVQGFNPQSRLYTGYFSNNSIAVALELVCLPMGLSYEIDKAKGLVRVYQ
jgi:ferric-dicitrate binding protein FerR (iron transport regulator)